MSNIALTNEDRVVLRNCFRKATEILENRLIRYVRLESTANGIRTIWKFSVDERPEKGEQV